MQGSKKEAVSPFYRWLPPGLVYLVIFWFSSRPPGFLPRGIPDVIPHFLEFLLLGFLTARAVRPRRWTAWVLIFVLLLILSMGDELHQSFVPGRICSLKDFLVDGAGAFAGQLLWGRIMSL